MKPLDTFGRVIEIGNFITYAVRSGNSGLLRVARVENIVDTKSGWDNRIIATIRTRGCSKDYTGKWKLGGLGNLQTLENIIVIPSELLPEEVFKLYG